MSRRNNIVLSLACLLLAASAVTGFATRRAVMTMKRRGGGKSLQKELGGNNKNIQSMSGGVMNSSKQWIPVSGMSSTAELPTEEGKVKIVETMVPALMDKATNPTGAVAVVKYGPNTYCTSISCASCKIPMTKARVLEANEETDPDPRLACDFCSATYNLRTGERVTSVEKGGLMGGIVKGLFSKADDNPLPVYELGESKQGKVVINLGS
jgi:nitrite reductase/ring-hydroxylating ferredoxin subunit